MQMPHFKRILIWLWSSTPILSNKLEVERSNGPTCMIAVLSAMKTDDIENHYYPHAEYNKCSNSQKEVLKRKCKARGQVPSLQDSNVPNKHKKLKKMAKHDFKKVNCNVSTIQQTVDGIVKFMKAEKATQNGADGTSSSNANNGNNGTNQNNASLTHQG
jgi:hypothetical protein